jgi:hypothetical protein
MCGGSGGNSGPADAGQPGEVVRAANQANSNPIGLKSGMSETQVLEKVNAHTDAAFKAIGEPTVHGSYSEKQATAYRQAMKEVTNSLISQGYSEKDSSRYGRWIKRFGPGGKYG